MIGHFQQIRLNAHSSTQAIAMFQSGGTGLILTWFIFALMALLFIPASAMLGKVLSRADTPYLSTATFMGVLSSTLQSVGLMRWVFVIPILAKEYVNSTSNVRREAIAIAYQIVHQYGGVVIGEHLGQILLVGWTLGVSIAMLHSHLFKSWVGWLGIFTVPFWMLGQSELLATVIPSTPVWEVAAVGFMMWEVWLMIVGIFLLRASKKRVILNSQLEP
ncbi:DUF4386 domain-containing protein [Iningainema tapete]|uniref:DUF4386 domain-containing protein n=1 Tax=Iningainema tapete TaxID=2806730 RepID=UPI001EE393F2|nr:DUF4386 domain-containing protein [Iningainema tapete]